MNTSPEKPGTTEDTSPTPLTLTKTLGDGSIVGPMTYPNTDIDFSALGESWIYHSQFIWDSVTPQGETLFQFSTRDNEQSYIPWQIFHLGIAQYINYAWQLGFLFVKLPDIRVSMDVEIRHTHPMARGYNPTDIDGPTETSIMEINNESFVTADVNPYWNGTMLINHKLTGDTNAFAAYFPESILQLKVRLPFVPTNLQPKSFEVFVFKRLINLSMEGTIVTPDSLPAPFRQHS